MFKKSLVAVVVLLSLTGVSYAHGGKTTILQWEPIGAENPSANGGAILLYTPFHSKTTVLMGLNDFTPNTVYDYEVVSPTMGSAVGCDQITTNSHGDAVFFTTLSGNWSDAQIVLYVSDDCSFTEDEVRAVGQPLQ